MREPAMANRVCMVPNWHRSRLTTTAKASREKTSGLSDSSASLVRKPRGLLAGNASGAAPCRSARHTCDAAGRPRPPDPCIRRIQRDRNDGRLREMQRQRDSAKHHAANERCSDDCYFFHEIPLLRYLPADKPKPATAISLIIILLLSKPSNHSDLSRHKDGPALVFKRWPSRLTALFARSLDIDQGRSTLVPAVGRKPYELALQCVDVSDIGRDEMIAAALAGHHLKMTGCGGGRRTRAAEMDEGREILLLAGGGLLVARSGENLSDMTVQIDGRELDRMARDRPEIETAKAASIIHHRMIADTGPRGLGVSAIGHLKQTDGARRRLIDRERVETPSPAPVGAVHRIARPLDLRQRGQQFGRDRAGGKLAEQRPVLPPRLGRLLVEPVTDEGEQLGRFKDHVIDEIHEYCDDKQDRHAARDLNRPWRPREPVARPTLAPPPAA